MNARYLLIMTMVCLCLWSHFSFAQGESKSPSNTHIDNPEGAFSWNLTIATDVITTQSIFKGADQNEASDFLELSILIDLYYKGFFIQTNKHRFGSYVNGAELGYELVVNDQYEIDLISKTYLPGFSEDEVGLIYDRVIPELAGITEREFISNQGIRYMGYLPNSVYWVDWAVNLFGDEHSGWVIDGFYSYILQQRNWDINIGAGISLYSSNMNNYYYSVKPEEATADRPIYQAGAGYRLQLEAFAQRPITEDWLLNGGVTLSHHSSSIADSPLTERQNAIRAQIGVSYVF